MTDGAPIITALIAAAAVLLSAFTAWRSRHVPVRAQALAEDAANDEHWAKIIEAQIKVQVEPLKEQVSELKAAEAKLTARVADMELALESQRTRFWGLINHVRQLKLWIVRHVPADIYRQHPLPTTTEELAADIAVDIT